MLLVRFLHDSRSALANPQTEVLQLHGLRLRRIIALNDGQGIATCTPKRGWNWMMLRPTIGLGGYYDKFDLSSKIFKACSSSGYVKISCDIQVKNGCILNSTSIKNLRWMRGR
jgi:hypothetical protein